MSKRRQRTTAATIARRIREGRGKGHFMDYKPWLTIHDVPSCGVATRVFGWKSRRVHHYFSEHFELAHHYQMEWASDVIDIREQYPLLPLEKTLFIAQKLGIKHPIDPKTKYPIVMTTDMLLTVRSSGEYRFKAHSIKPIDKLNQRVLEKLQIERIFMEDQGVEWRLITENQINYDLVKNVEWLHSFKNLEESALLNNKLLCALEPILYERITNQNQPLAKITLELDQREGLLMGTSMNVVRYLIANRLWEVDMKCRILPTQQRLEILVNHFQSWRVGIQS
ncbi:TnsA endonuclease N-terminal domain-containing protein [Paenibacillus alvei]|uniref:Heteromeric transposase endonuclease subunit TnsA n=1 Tax=Paenibacillus alvei TaxID=44250 RepID=A0AAP7A2W4_PAEAL|nr:TnsA endonuclease N-terminal domain-containing protein [Paenibacillus alvei]NOJ73559.1 heteromeric transposase endonuclease subunit TnsA [Paenibacillus alvei]